MITSKIMLIRQAEKSDDADAILGVTVAAEQEPHELAVRGSVS